MERQQPNERQQDRLSDVDLVILEVAQALEQKRPISDAGARVIASMLHNGQGSAMYALSSSGAILEALDAEIALDEVIAGNSDNLEIETWAKQLRTYMEHREDHGPVEGWHNLWLDRPVAGYDEDDRCTICAAHISEPHSPVCPNGQEEAEDEPEEKLTLEETIKRDFVGVPTDRLIRRMERAPESKNLDDETYELSRRLKEDGKTWKWVGGYSDPRIEVIELGEVEA